MATAIVGVTGINDDVTVLYAVDVDVTAVDAKRAPTLKRLGEVQHRAGFAPLGVVVDGHHLALVLAQNDHAQGLLVDFNLKTGKERDLLDEVMVQQRPQLRRDAGVAHLTVVRGREHGAAGGSFDVVDVAIDHAHGGVIQTQIRASAQRLWITPAAGDAGAVLVINGGDGYRGDGADDGDAAIAVVDDGVLKDVVALGAGAFRTPVFFGGRHLIERSDVPGKRASLVDGTGHVWRSGIPGLSPVIASGSAGTGLLATSSGRKNGEVVVWRDGSNATLSSGRPGVARPHAVVDSAAGPVVVAWLDRGAQLPGELLAISKAGGQRLLPPKAHQAVTVYGFLDGPSSASSSSSSPARTVAP
jgi:hypothetical protein